MFEMCRAKSENSKVSAKAALVSLRTLHHSVQCCFTSTEAVGIVRDGEPSTSTSTFSQLLSSEFRNIKVKCRFTSTETVGTIRDGEPNTATSTFTQLQSFVLQGRFTSTETVGTIRDGEPNTATSTFTQLRNSVAWRAGEDCIIIINTLIRSRLIKKRAQERSRAGRWSRALIAGWIVLLQSCSSTIAFRTQSS